MSPDFLAFVAVGFCAQLVDGALGMAFGLLATTALMSLGLPPAAASAMTHVAEIFTTAASGASHLYHRNVDWRLVLRLAPPGVAGGAVGAYLLGSAEGRLVAPVVSLYLATVGLYILFKAFRPAWPREVRDRIVPLVGFGGGALDAAGGGGWGAIVTGSLVGRGHAPRTVIGSTNLTEFVVAATVSATFVAMLGWGDLRAAAGLVAGGVAAAPLGGYLVKKLPTRPLMFVVGIVILAISATRLL